MVFSSLIGYKDIMHGPCFVFRGIINGLTFNKRKISRKCKKMNGVDKIME